MLSLVNIIMYIMPLNLLIKITFIPVYLSGRFDLETVSHYQCVDCPVTLPFKLDIEAVIKMGFWPGTPTNMCHLFARDLLDYWDMAQKAMPGVSERSFITSLEDFSSAKGRVCLLCRAETQSRLKSYTICQLFTMG